MGDVVKVSLPIKIKQESVFCHGYGAVPKFAMCDSSLPLTAKAIYAYFCSLAGSGNTSHPGWATVLNRLNINKDTYYKNMDILKEQGYISVHKQDSPDGKFPHNTYCLEMNPKKFSEQYISAGKTQNTISFQGIKAAGYGLIPRAVLMDARLHVKAKGIYAYFASFTGIGEAAFPEVSMILYHLGINQTTYRKYLKSLLSTNYLTIEQQRNNGQLGANKYFLVANPDETVVVPKKGTTQPKHVINQKTKPARPSTRKKKAAESIAMQEIQPSVKKPETVKSETEEPEVVLPELAKPEVVNPEVEKPEAIKTSNTITSSLNIRSSYNQSIYPAQRDDLVEMIDGLNENELNELILKRIGVYDELFGSGSPSPQALGIQRLVGLVVNTITVKTPTIRIAKADRSRLDVVNTLFGLTKEHYIYVMESIQKVQKPIKNPVQYQLTALYYAPTTYTEKSDSRSNAWMRKYIAKRGNGFEEEKK